MAGNTEKLGRLLADLDRRVGDLETYPQLRYSSVDDFGVPVLDADGNVVARLGKQTDGTWGAPPLAGPVPTEPKGVAAIGTAGGVEIEWLGATVGGTLPLDFDAVEILADDAPAGAIHNGAGGRIFVPLSPGPHRITARTRTTVPVYSSPVDVATVEISPSAVALAEELAASISTASKMNTIATAGPRAAGTEGAAEADGYPNGAYWTRIEPDPTTGDLVARERWTVLDGTWTPVGLDASTLVTGTVDAGLIDAVALAARMVTAGLIRTSATGQRVELTSDGLILWLVDADGVEYEGVRIGPTGATLITVGKTLITPSAVTSPAGNFGAVSIAGQDAAAFVDGRIQYRGAQLVAIGGAGLAGGNITADANVETGLFDILVPRIIHDAWYRADVLFVSYPTGLEVESRLALRVSRGDQGVMTNSPRIDDRPLGAVRSDIWDSRSTTFWFRGSQLASSPGVTNGGSARLLLTMTGQGRRLIAGTATTMAVYLEASPAIGFSATINRGGAPAAGSTTATPQQPVTQVQTYVKTYTATGSTTYYSASNAVDNYTMSRTGDVIQGSYNGSASDRRHGIWWFPDMTADLAGATVKNVEIYAAANRTYASAGGTAHFWTHPGTSQAVSNVMNASFTAGQSRWLQLPSQFWQQFKDGGAKGFMAYTASSSTSEYMRFDGGAGSAQIRITYEK